MKKLDSIQGLRGVAAWAVVGHHIEQLFGARVKFGVLGEFFKVYGGMGVDLFFVISGLLYTLARKISAGMFLLKKEFLE